MRFSLAILAVFLSVLQLAAANPAVEAEMEGKLTEASKVYPDDADQGGDDGPGPDRPPHRPHPHHHHHHHPHRPDPPQPPPNTCEAARAAAIDLHRLFTAKVHDHFYVSATNKAAAVVAGVREEGITGAILPRAIAGAVELCQLYHPRQRHHYYTTSTSDADFYVRSGYIKQDPIGFVFTSQNACLGLIPIYRLFIGSRRVVRKQYPGGRAYYNNIAINDYILTTSDAEKAALRAQGWQDKGIVGYTYPRGGGTYA
ncbi:hypothetical protein HGRIS_011053 [Hohenbuehelia grisea]|uniref:DUF5648 domain-containing protein n=1 Tax=Hohenbuehelia grisea TaxID=104357 RepID=A0ABR3IYP4_9AGAR